LRNASKEQFSQQDLQLWNGLTLMFLCCKAFWG
jgi:hypothetical protein